MATRKKSIKKSTLRKQPTARRQTTSTKTRKSGVVTVRHRLGVSQKEMSRVTGYSVRSIAGWEGGEEVSAAARQKLAEVARLRDALAEIMEPDAVGDWLRTPNQAFEGQTPIQVIERGELDRIWRMIYEIEAGVAS